MEKLFFKKFTKNIFWKLYGRTIRNPPIPFKIKSILFVCLGNICRSPFAEHIATRISGSGVPNQYEFYSAGILVKDPISPPKEAVIAANNFGVNMKDHKSRSINYRMMESYDLIIAMETWHYKFLRKLFLEFQEKIFLLPLLENNNEKSIDNYYIYNIKDPYGRDLSDFIICYKRINDSLAGLFDEINKN